MQAARYLLGPSRTVPRAAPPVQRSVRTPTAPRRAMPFRAGPREAAPVKLAAQIFDEREGGGGITQDKQAARTN